MKSLHRCLRLAVVSAALAAPLPVLAQQVTVYHNPSCGCCGKWVEHLEANGFSVTTVPQENLEPVKRRLGIPPELGSCHTALVEGYAVEGHVPAQSLRRLLKEKPSIVGLAVPGMPQGSPGMESPTPERYNVIAFDEARRSKVFDRY